MAAGQHKIESFLWANDRGELLKMIAPTLQQEVVRTTKADALHPPAGGTFDLITSPTVKITGPLVPTPKTTRAVYRAHLKTVQIAGLFTDCPSQRVKPIDNQTAQLTVLAIRPNSPLDGVQSPSPASEDSSPGNFIQSDDSVIQQMAARVAPRETDPWMIACPLEKFVAEAVKNKNFSTAFATAAEVARSLEGDCTEHAVLMAALCRARKIPARTAFGLIYYPPEKGFAYHMWNEVWIADRWVPMDPTLGQGGIGADHIKLGDSNLAGSSPLADLLSVIQVFGQLELEVVEIN
jgi:transglutaminase-like putative cysteine protease